MSSIVVTSFYRFVPISDPAGLQRALQVVLEANDVRGTVLVAEEGINGTVAGSRAGIDAVREHLGRDGRFAALEYKEATAASMPFSRTKVRVKGEIVSMGVAGVDPNRAVGTYVDPAEWNALISDPSVVVVDARNEYEVRVGSFEGALNPHTESFRELPAYLDAQFENERGRKIAMFCTGGIRCEKSTSYLRQKGFEHVYHLRGGILKYLESVPESESMWRGECFVFDERVSVEHGLSEGTYSLCRACRMPLSPRDREHPGYVPGISCPHCISVKSDLDRIRYRERERQMALTRQRDVPDIPGDSESNLQPRRM